MTLPCSTQLTGQPVKVERVVDGVVQATDSPDAAVHLERISSTRPPLVGPNDAEQTPRPPPRYAVCVGPGKPTLPLDPPIKDARAQRYRRGRKSGESRLGSYRIAGKSIQSLRLELCAGRRGAQTKMGECGKRSNRVPPLR
jgi:hypothetical protein